MSTEEIQESQSNQIEDELITTIGRCQEVLKDLETSKAWEIVLEDANQAINAVDALWQDTFDETTMMKARVSKMAYKHIAEMANRYRFDLESASKALEVHRNPETQTVRDWD